ncbi:MAG TPA: tetratricopeptide repeat protein [Sedimentisphaerales bacterium]|nr:tetratricopeptide repeat protein [Sedimentisphaerales bacterium]
MPEKNNSDAEAKARFFFDNARKAAEHNDFDAAIDMYLDGLRCAPDAIQEGHIKLRELSVKRQAAGGEKASSEEVAERQKSETALERMLNAEYLLAKDPSYLPYAEAILKAAAAGGYKDTAKWIADLIFLANKKARKPSLQIYLLLKDSYEAIGRLGRALSACEYAAKLRPGDETLAAEVKRLSEKRAAAKGKYLQQDVLKESVGSAEEEEELEGVRSVVGGEDSYFGADENGKKDDWLGDMPGEIDPAVARASSFFSKAKQVAAVNDYDYAIELYLKGLSSTPEAVEEGHIPLCELALQRQRKGGKKPSMMERVKRLRGKTPLEQMLNAEHLFAKDPNSLSHAGVMLKAAVSGGFTKTANWIANYLFQMNNAAKKPSFKVYVLLKNSYTALGQFDKALAACQCAARIRPADAAITDELKNLTAELTVSRGKYDREGDFRQSIKDRQMQERLRAQDSLVKTKDFRLSVVEEARKALAEDPNLPKNVFNLAQALFDLEQEESENEAIALLESTYKSKGDFSFKQRAGQMRISQLKRKIREAKGGLEAEPDEVGGDAAVAELMAQFNRTEMEHYCLCVENYPTDLKAKYEYAVRLLRNKRYDEAIPLFQEAHRDPRHKIAAMGKTGLCFLMKGWFADAVDVFTQAIDAYEIKDDGTAKELRYNLGRAYEEQGETEKALEIYRKIAQLDFGFKDVRQRVDKLRSKGT